MMYLTEVLYNSSGKRTVNLVDRTPLIYVMARDCIASNDRMTVTGTAKVFPLQAQCGPEGG